MVVEVYPALWNRTFPCEGRTPDQQDAFAIAKCFDANTGLMRAGPDLIILDFSMPVMDGLQAARKLRQLMPEVPLILFTQYADSTVLAIPDLPVEQLAKRLAY